MLKNIIIGIFAVVAVCIIFLLDLPKFQSISNLNNALATKQQQLKEKQNLIARVEKLTKGYQENQEILKKIDYLVPNNPDIPNLIVQIEALTQENGMSLDAVDFRILETKTTGKAEELRSGETGTAEKPVQNYHLLDINIRISGDYPAFKNFLKEIENNIRLFDLQSVGFISATSKEGETGKFEFDINLQAYYKP